jgi:hypothetical protein
MTSAAASDTERGAFDGALAAQYQHTATRRRSARDHAPSGIHARAVVELDREAGVARSDGLDSLSPDLGKSLSLEPVAVRHEEVLPGDGPVERPPHMTLVLRQREPFPRARDRRRAPYDRSSLPAGMLRSQHSLGSR